MARPVKHDGGLVQTRGIEDLVDAVPGQGRCPPDGNRLLLKTGTKRRSASGSVCKPETTTRCPRCAAGRISHFGEWADFYLENFSKPPFRAPKTHEVNQRALKHLRKMFENTKLADLTADDIEMYLRGGSNSECR